MLEFDFPGLEIGGADYPDRPTGCTVIQFSPATFPDGMALELDVRGHTIGDGDVLFAVTTGEVANERIDARDLGVVASELAWDAVLSSFDRETKR
jgi:L-aminopeptidase/D-esterase-like protein